MNLKTILLKKKNVLKTSIITVASLLSTGLLANDLYVSPTGSNANPGTIIAPFNTISKASQLAVPGTVIHVAPGNYAGGFQTAANGSASSPIRYVSDTKWGAKILGSGSSYIWVNTGNYVIVDGFELTGAGNAHGLLSGPWSSSGPQDVGHHFTATNNYVHDMAVNFCGQGGAITVFSPTGHSRITNNIIKNVAVSKIGSCATMQGIYISDADSYIANNIVSGIAAVGIHQWHGATRSTIVNNTVFNCLWGILLGSGDNGMLPNGSQNNYVANNISVNNSTYGIREYGPTSINTYRNNLLYNNPNNLMNASGDSVSGTITTNPMFVNFQLDGTGDYHLLSSSPAIDKGLSLSAPLTDLDGAQRPQGAAVDIGAYEFKSSVVVLAANASFSATALSFDNTNVLSKSVVKVLTVSNNGNAPLTLKSLNISSDYMIAGSGSCVVGNSYAPGSSCTVDLLFAPSIAGLRSGVLGVSSNSSPNSLTNISLSGTGVAVVETKKPIASLSVRSLSFPNIVIGSQSATQIVTISNSGNAPLLFSQAFSMSGDFVFGGTGTCALNVSYAPGASCTASVVFKPTVIGVRSGSLSISSNGSAAPLLISLTGNGVSTIIKAPIASFSTKALNFGSIKIGSKSAIQLLTITNTGNAPLIDPQAFIMTGAGFAFGGTGTCALNVSYAPGASCTASVIFKPTARGAQAGSLSILTNASTTPVKIVLSGTGI